MSFAWDTIHYPTRLEYQAALMPFAVPGWIKGVTIHHTFKPTQANWRGERTMEVLKRYYSRTLRWPAGPHLFLAPDGIWAGTPLSHTGVHAGKCNETSIGLEVVGNFDVHGWDIGLKERLYMLVVLLLHWAGLTERAVTGHRECLPNKSCPGSAINMATVRRELHERLFSKRFIVTTDTARVRADARVNSAVIRGLHGGNVLPAHPVRGQLYRGSNIWARVRLPSSVTGYIWGGLGRWEAV